MQVVDAAWSQIGVLERGKNLTPFGKWYGEHAGQSWNGQPWCAMFVSWCYWRAGFALPEMQAPGYSGFASCPIGLEACRQRGWLVNDPQPGDIAFIGPRHVGLVVLASQVSGLILTVEGNVAGPLGRDGVFLTARRWHEASAFARPVFDPERACHGPCWVCGECPA